MTTDFTPFTATLGGIVIGLAAALLLLFNGRIAGISGMLHGLCQSGRQAWQAIFLTGLMAGAWAVEWALENEAGKPSLQRQDFPLIALLVAGLLVGMGTRLGSGCTSGHGVCGIGRRSVRAITATVVFMLTAFATTYVARHWLRIN